MSNELKARAPEELIEKADTAAKIDGVTRSELIRQAVDEKADAILSDLTDPSPGENAGEVVSDGIGTAIQQPDAPVPNEPEGYNYLREYADELDSLEQLSERMTDEDVEYPFGPTEDVDWSDKEVVGRSYSYRLPVIRSFLDSEWTEEGCVPDPVLRNYITDLLDYSRGTLYNDLERMPKVGCAYPNPKVDPKWDEEAVRQDILDYICANSNRDREEYGEQNQELMDLLPERANFEEGDEQIYGEYLGDVWYLTREDWEDVLDSQLMVLKSIVLDIDDDEARFDREKYVILLEHFMDYLEERSVSTPMMNLVDIKLSKLSK